MDKNIIEQQIKKAVEDTIDEMNHENCCIRCYNAMIEENDKLGKTLAGIFELFLRTRLKNMFPELQIIHPENDTKDGDIFSVVLQDGFEVKFTITWKDHNTGEYKQTAWSQGTIQELSKKFLFVNAEFNLENELYVRRAYYGKLSYNDWRVHGKGMNIGINKVKEFCEKIIDNEDIHKMVSKYIRNKLKQQ